jgi:hypothetical protein
MTRQARSVDGIDDAKSERPKTDQDAAISAPLPGG